MNTNKSQTRPVLRCSKCDQILRTRVKRNFLIKTLLFWLPLKVFFCSKCLKRRYTLQWRTPYRRVSHS
jgi:hypothetical protein